MKSTDLLRKELDLISNTTEIIDVMKKVAISQFGNLDSGSKERAGKEEPLNKYLAMCDILQCKHIYLHGSAAPTTVVMVTSDDGFVGGLNSQIISKALDLKKEHNAEMIVIGGRGSGYLEEMNERFAYFPGISEDVAPEEVNKIKDYLLDQYLSGKRGKIVMVYPKLITFFHQEVETFQLLPCRHIFPDPLKRGRGKTGEERRDMERRAENRGRRSSDRRAEGIVSETRFYSKQRRKKNRDRRNEDDRRIDEERRGPELFFDPKYRFLSIEPSIDRVVDYLVMLWVEQRLYAIMTGSKLSEFAARVMHLEGNFQEFTRENRQIKYEYMRSSHESVDRAIREVFASKVIWKK